MHDSSLPESADVTPRHPGERPKLRPLIGVPEGALKENRRSGAIIAILSHLLIVVLLILPAFFHREITDALTEGAGGPGAAGGGGGGSGGSPVIPERIQRYQLPPPPAKSTPSVLPPLAPVPEVKKPEVTPPKVEPTPAPTPAPAPETPAPATATPATPAPGTGAGAGAGTDPGPGNGPGTGGGNGSGAGTGTGSSVGAGTGGGNATIYPPTPRALFVPPNGTPRRLRGKTIVIELDVDESGKVLAAEFSPRSGDGGYDDQFLASLKEQRFKPAVRANGQPVRFTYRYEILM
jgi:periplasmic protein TonB